MENLSLPSSEPQILPPSAPELQEIVQQLKSAAGMYRKAIRLLMFYGWKLRIADRWGELGYADEEAFRLDCDIPQSSWYKFVNLGFDLRQLPLEDLFQIRTTTLELMTQIGTELWPRFPWVDEAKQLKPADFAELITERKKQCLGTNDEPMCYVKWKVPYSSKEFLEHAIEDFQKKHQLPSTGRALELLVADMADRPNVLGMLNEALVLAFQVQKRLMQKGFEDSEVHAKLDTIRGLLDAEATLAIYQARQIERNQGRQRSNGGWS